MQTESEKIKIIYLLGAGRSGTTLLTTVLNNHPKILALGEMHQFLDYVKFNKDCSCGEELINCPFWRTILKDLDLSKLKKQELVDLSNRLEKHYNIPLHLIKRTPNPKYKDVIEMTFGVLKKNVAEEWLLDSSKYISRYLLLRKNKNLHIKGIYLVRDVRGVIHSFNKKVQTPKEPLSAILYYMLINLWAQFITIFDSRIIRIRYEDFVNNPDEILEILELHIFEKNLTSSKVRDKIFKIPHIIAGNRLRSQKELIIKKDMAWNKDISRNRQIAYYLIAFPIMLLNKYKI